MLNRLQRIADESVESFSSFFSSAKNIQEINDAFCVIKQALSSCGKILVFGNGGSAADSQHFAAELIVRFQTERKALPCMALTCNSSVLTAHSNDYSFDTVFARQIAAFGRKGDVALAISTSGESTNVLEGVKSARSQGMKVITLTGRAGGHLIDLADMSINVPIDNTAQVQQIHIAVLHMFCALLDEEFPEHVRK